MGFRRLKFFRNLRTTLYALVLGLFVLACVTVLYLNATGMPESWRATLEQELSKQGIEVKIKKLRYIPLRGIEATEVEVFVDETRQKRLAHLERLVFDLDKTKAMRGIIRLTHIDLRNAELRLPVDPQQPDGEVLNIKNLNGTILMSRSRKFEIKQGTGLIDGIQLTVDAVILGFRPLPGYQGGQESSGLHRRFLREFVKEINHWQLDPEHPPELTLKIEADANKWSALKGQFRFSCASASRGEIHLQDVQASGNVVHSLISVHQLKAHDQRGKIDMALDYELATRSGNFEVESTLDAPHWIYDLTGKRLLDDFSLAESPHLHLRGQFSLPADQPMQLRMHGRMATQNLLFRGSPLSSMTTEFSYDNNDFFFRNISLKHEGGELRGHLLQKNQNLRLRLNGDVPLSILRPLYRDLPVATAVAAVEAEGQPKITATIEATLTKNNTYELQWLELKDIAIDHPRGKLTGQLRAEGSQVHYEMETSFPPELGKAFFPNQALETILGDFTSNKSSSYAVKLKGRLDRKEKTAWAVEGTAKVENISYRDVPVHSCSTTMNLSHGSLLFSDIAVDFDYSQYELQRAYQGGTHGPVQAGSVVYDRTSGLVQINKLRGNLHPVPLLRMFAKSIADSITEYRFHVPPTLTADGSIDVRNEGRTQLNVSLVQAKAVTWEFLDQPVTFSDVSSVLQIDSQQVVLNRLSAGVFSGNCAGIVRVKHSGEKRFEADLRWNNLKMRDISETYKFQEKGYGTLTGRIDLKGITGNNKTLEGEGLCALDSGELFAVPVFGPLSGVIAGVLGDRRAGFERAKNAFCNFTIRKGILQTNDFLTYTSNLKFTGNGIVDLDQSTIDMTIRMNARGLLGVITLPLQPIIKGLFQFHGKGPMNKPEWEHVVFTSPPEAEKEALLRSTPRKAMVVPE